MAEVCVVVVIETDDPVFEPGPRPPMEAVLAAARRAPMARVMAAMPVEEARFMLGAHLWATARADDRDEPKSMH